LRCIFAALGIKTIAFLVGQKHTLLATFRARSEAAT
jgi:hypothetical protein